MRERRSAAGTIPGGTIQGGHNDPIQKPFNRREKKENPLPSGDGKFL